MYRNLINYGVFSILIFTDIVWSSSVSLIRHRRSAQPPLKLLSSTESLFEHLNWGNESQSYRKYLTDTDKRVYVGFGQCISRWPIFYPQHIQQATKLDLIIMAYTEILRVYCKDNIQQKYLDLFDKGYARLVEDHSISYSNHTILFIKPKLSFWEEDDLENLIEFSAFTQVYVSWYRFPVISIDPLGNEIKDACFIEIVARLHAIDLIMVVARRHTAMIAYLMAVKLKLVIKMMHEDFKGIKGHDIQTKHRRLIAKRCLVVTMTLMEFLFRRSESSLKYGCSHTAFKTFYRKKEKMYQKIVERYGRKPGSSLLELDEDDDENDEEMMTSTTDSELGKSTTPTVVKGNGEISPREGDGKTTAQNSTFNEQPTLTTKGDNDNDEMTKTKEIESDHAETS